MYIVHTMRSNSSVLHILMYYTAGDRILIWHAFFIVDLCERNIHVIIYM